MTSPIQQIPDDIFRDMILPFTYYPQSPALLSDLRSYCQTMVRIKSLYSRRWPGEGGDEPLAAQEWLSNDITRFLNKEQPTMFGIVGFYKEVFQRLYMNRGISLQNVRIPCAFGDEQFSDIKVSIGLLRPGERIRIETFLGVANIL